MIVLNFLSLLMVFTAITSVFVIAAWANDFLEALFSEKEKPLSVQEKPFTNYRQPQTEISETRVTAKIIRLNSEKEANPVTDLAKAA